MRAIPFLMFQGKAEEAMHTYVSLFPDAKIESIERYGPEGPGVENSVKQARFQIAGQRVMCIDSPVEHAFGFTPRFSFFVDCNSREELEKLYASLSDNGEILMPLDDYEFSQRFAWVSDRFGVSWQINLP